MGDNGGEGDPIDNQLKEIAKRMEMLLHSRMNQFNEQLQTMFNDVQELKQRSAAIEQAIIIQSENTKFILRNVSLLTQELDAIEMYMARTDPELREIITRGLKKQQDELAKRKLISQDEPPHEH